MDSIHLSPRLQMVADFVPPCACAADIGTDHGYLPVWLLQNGVVQTAIAADIHVGPLANARKSAAAYDLEERVRFVQADGLQFPDAQAADVITIAGMGGETICAILTATPWLRQGKRLVLQPQSKVQELTDWLWHNGFTIEDAALCRDAGKRYLALRVLGQPAGQTYTVEQLLPLLADIGCGNVGIHYDTYHACLEEANLLASLETALKSGRVTHFHACANNRGAPGDGIVPWDAVMQLLKQYGYAGHITMETFAPGGLDASWVNVHGTPDEVALRGLHFLQRYF